MATPLSAANAVVRINGATVACKRWQVTPKVDALDTTSFEDAGYGNCTAGIKDCDITLEFDYDSSAPQYSNPPNIFAGATLTNVLLYTNGTSSAKWTFASSLVVDSACDAAVRDVIKG